MFSIKLKSLSLTALVLAVSGLLSRFLGLFRDNLLANLFVKSQTDVYFAAFRIPDFIYGVLIAGGVAAAFLPVFAEVRGSKGEEEAKKLVGSVFLFFVFSLSAVSLLLSVLSPVLVNFVAPGFDYTQKKLMVGLVRIMFASPVLLGASAIFSSTLQYFNLFVAFALAPIFYNLGIIFGILVLAPIFGLKGLAMGVALGALLHFLSQGAALLKAGFVPKLCFNFCSEGLKKILRLMAPRMLGTAAYQINLVVITAIASVLPAGSVSIFNFSNNIQGAVIALAGISFASAAFPRLSKAFVEKNKKKFLDNFSSTFSKIIFLIIPLSSLFFLLRARIVRLILGTSFLNGGYFDWTQTRLTSASLGIFSLALFAACLTLFFTKAFFSLQNTKTPVKIAVFTILLNIAFSWFFTRLLGFSNFFSRFFSVALKLKGLNNISVIGLPLAISLSVLVQCCLLFLALKRRFPSLSLFKACPFLGEIICASSLSIVFSYFFLSFSAVIFNTATVIGLFLQTASAALLAAALYLFSAASLGVPEAQKTVSLLARIGGVFKRR